MQALSGDAEVRWEMQPAINSAGGLLCIWSDETFKMESFLSFSLIIVL